MTIITWLLAVLSLVGVVMNIKKQTICFVIWAFTNISWMTIDFIYGIYAQAFLMLVYTGLSIAGFILWKKENKKNESIQD